MRPVVLLNFDSPSLAARVAMALPPIVATLSGDDCANPVDRVVGIITDRPAPAHDRDDRGALPTLVLAAGPHHSASSAALRWFSVNNLAVAMEWFTAEIEPSISRLDRYAAAYADSIALSDAEARAFRLLVSGHSAQTSAQRLGKSVRSIEHQHSAIRRKANEGSVAGVLSQFACFCAEQSSDRDYDRARTERASGVALTARARLAREQ